MVTPPWLPRSHYHHHNHNHHHHYHHHHHNVATLLTNTLALAPMVVLQWCITMALFQWPAHAIQARFPSSNTPCNPTFRSKAMSKFVTHTTDIHNFPQSQGSFTNLR